MVKKALLTVLSMAIATWGQVALSAPTAVASINSQTSVNTTMTQTESQTSAQKKQVRPKKVFKGSSVAAQQGLRQTPDPLDLSSSVALVLDRDSGQVLLSKNSEVPLPIASITKLMTALVIERSGLDMNAKLRVTKADYVASTARSPLISGMRLTRADALRAALMSSDNRAAHLLARTYPGGVKAFVQKMNETAQSLGMVDTHYSDPTGLSNKNISTAQDLALLVQAMVDYDRLTRASTAPMAMIQTGRGKLRFRTTNRLVVTPNWKVQLQKTGHTRAAGRCMVVDTEVDGRNIVMVVLDSVSNRQRIADMQRMRQWVESEYSTTDRQFAKSQAASQL